MTERRELCFQIFQINFPLLSKNSKIFKEILDTVYENNKHADLELIEEVKQIYDLAEQKYGSSLKGRLGVCLDTCHIWDAGYDIVNDLDGVLAEFDRIVGLDKLHALHINDSKNPYASHKDRHECLGKGHLGLEAFQRIVNHPLLKDKPMILETPNELPGYAAEIALLREMENK